ncbi:MAG: MinD/ParA family protein, partial [Lachnospiraceae bacterium]
VATPEPTSITDSYALLKALRMFPGFEQDKTKIMLLGNKTNTPKDGVNMYEKLSTVVERFLQMKIEYVGSVPADDYVVKAIMKQSPVTTAYPGAAASKAYKHIMEKLTEGSENAVAKEKRGIGNFFNNVLKHNNRF